MTTGALTHRDNPDMDIAKMTDADVEARLQTATYNARLAESAARKGECDWSVVSALKDRVRELEIESMYRHAPGFCDPDPRIASLLAQANADQQRSIDNVRLIGAFFGV